MQPNIKSIILKSLKAQDVTYQEKIQTLWSGYGEIARYKVTGGIQSSVVLKHVKLPEEKNHPRGWNTDISHQRKIKSYQVESAWYQELAQKCDDSCRIPKCYAVEKSAPENREMEFLILLEDLNAAGYPVRKRTVSIEEMKACLKWLANFHAVFLTENQERHVNNKLESDNQFGSGNKHCPSNKLWSIGTYWHLDTRSDELKALDDIALKSASSEIDKKLNQCRFQTLVHGDAKLANFCFSKDGLSVAAVDFQYIGGGCGMKDVAYFIGSCLYEEDCEKYEKELLDIYFSELEKSLSIHQQFVDFNALEKEWRNMYSYAWTDFHRFIKGWSPGHWKIHGYSERIAREVIANLTSQKLSSEK